MGELEHRFDWYQASVPGLPEAVMQQLLATMPSDTVSIDGRGMNSFKHRRDYAIPGESEVIATVMHGGVNPHPNVKTTGDRSPALASVLRHLWPDHRVSRLDVAIDMRGEGVFDACVSVMSKVGRDNRLKGKKILPDDLDDGSTYYLGGELSPLRARCYEKGKQLHKLTGDPVWRQLFDWTRLELQVRPQKGFKSAAAKMPPEAFWGCSQWTRELSAGALALNPLPVAMKPTRISDQERAMRYAIQQYGPTFLRQIAKLGSWEAFTDDLRERLEEKLDVAIDEKRAA
jgi:hypothetical protein